MSGIGRNVKYKLFTSTPLGKIVKLVTLLSIIATSVLQFYRGLSLPHLPKYVGHGYMLGSQVSGNNSAKERSEKRSGFGACLMFKDDLELLPEWIAYHYVSLPLRHLVIGLDRGNRQDPFPVLNRYNGTELRFTVFQPERNSSVDPRLTVTKEESHHGLILRQKQFVSKCALYLQGLGYGWTTLIDPDEFVAPNHIGDDEEELEQHLGQPSSSGVEMRRTLNQGGFRKVIDRLQEWEKSGVLPKAACFTMPRLLIGALENSTCDKMNMEGKLHLSTIRFVQYAPKGDFSHSKFGKVMIDLSRYPSAALKPGAIRSIHRPSKDLCSSAVPHFLSTPLILQHYIGSWERYQSRADGRRNRAEWEKRAFMNAGANCRMREWLSIYSQTTADWQKRLEAIAF